MERNLDEEAKIKLRGELANYRGLLADAKQDVLDCQSNVASYTRTILRIRKQLGE